MRGHGVTLLVLLLLPCARAQHAQHAQLRDAQQQDVQKQDVQKQDVQKQDVQQRDVQQQDAQKQNVQHRDVQQHDVQQQDVQHQDVQQQDVQQQEVQQQSAKLQDVQKQDAQQQQKHAEYWRRVEESLLDGSAHLKGLILEGDVIVYPDQLGDLRNAEADPSTLWPNKEVPILLAPGEWSAEERAKLMYALDDMMQNTCVRFVPREGQRDYLLLRNIGHQCASVVGYHRGAGGIPTFLGGPGCHRRGTLQHEMLHNLGVWHEHTRPDRDQHVTVLWKHIIPGREFNFLTRPSQTVRTLGLPYDYASVMHYRALAFSRDGYPTLLPAQREALAVLGQRIRFSPLDIAKINVLYDCPAPYYRGDKNKMPFYLSVR